MRSPRRSSAAIPTTPSSPSGPEKYNELWAKLRNLNRLLAWGHARAIENILERVPAGRRSPTSSATSGSSATPCSRRAGRSSSSRCRGPRRTPAVAAASILARAEFLTRLHFLSKDVGLELPKGASDQVEAAAVKLVRDKGPDILGKVAKTHFKTTVRVLAAAGVDRLV